MRFSVEDGCFSYKKGNPLLRNICFSVEGGKIAAILGPNGSGKTTLLRCAMSLLRWSSGQSLLDGEDISAMPYRERWGYMSYVPQARGSNAAYTAEEAVMLGRAAHINTLSKPGARDIDAVEAVFSRLGISQLQKEKCSNLSGGELQMVLIARSLAAEPKVLFLDEPESSLDFRNQLVVMGTLKSLAKSGIAVIFNTHYPAHALQWADKALILNRSGEALFGASEEIVTEKNIAEAFGVTAVIKSFDTPGGVSWDVLPLSIIDTNT